VAHCIRLSKLKSPRVRFSLLQGRLTFGQPQKVTSDGDAMPTQKPFWAVLHSRETSRAAVGVWKGHLVRLTCVDKEIENRLPTNRVAPCTSRCFPNIFSAPIWSRRHATHPQMQFSARDPSPHFLHPASLHVEKSGEPYSGFGEGWNHRATSTRVCRMDHEESASSLSHRYGVRNNARNG